jgi:hypothetical protein
MQLRENLCLALSVLGYLCTEDSQVSQVSQDSQVPQVSQDSQVSQVSQEPQREVIGYRMVRPVSFMSSI